jgi:hypothetical protein
VSSLERKTPRTSEKQSYGQILNPLRKGNVSFSNTGSYSGSQVEMAETALKMISENVEEFFAVRNLGEAEVYFSSLPPRYHHFLVDKIVSSAIESKEDDAKLVSQFFFLAALKELCSAASFEQGLTPVAENCY